MCVSRLQGLCFSLHRVPCPGLCCSARFTFSSLHCEYIWLIESDKSLTRDFLPEIIGPTIQKSWVQIRPRFLNLMVLGQLVSLCASVYLFTKHQGHPSDDVIVRTTNKQSCKVRTVSDHNSCQAMLSISSVLLLTLTRELRGKQKLSEALTAFAPAGLICSSKEPCPQLAPCSDAGLPFTTLL